MSDLKGFWSYVHSDDEAESGRIRILAGDLQSQFEMLTGDKVELFLDRNDIQWGDNWRLKVDRGLALTAFFIPILTPRYFMSPECRRELHSFAVAASDLGVKELLLPLLYVDVPTLHDGEASDELIALVATYQWEDWRDLRFAETTSEAYRRAVAHLAERLVEANAKADRTDIQVEDLVRMPGIEHDESPGVIDLLAAAEEALPEWTSTIEAMGEDVVLVGDMMRESTQAIERADSQGKGFAARLATARELARKLEEPSERILARSGQWAAQLHKVDAGVRIMVERGVDEARGDPESMAALCSFFTSVRGMATVAHEALDSTQEMVDGIPGIEALSRELRAPMRRIRQGLTTLVEGRDVTDDWVRLIDATGIECPEPDDGETEGQVVPG